ncbi:MAG: DUF4249 family protein [Aureispira sp.]|nr:DUF4249 family protein [Aureispira sp.]
MKKVGLLSALVLLFFLNISCEKEIDLKAQAPSGQLYANSILNPDSVFRVFLSYSTLITAPLDDIHDRLDKATQALVVIKDSNGTLIDTLEFITGVYSGINSSFLVFESIEGLRPLANETYELHVEEMAIKNSKTIFATARLPAFFNPIQANKRFPIREITGKDQTFGIELSWEDPNPMEDNFFIIEATYRNTSLSSGSPELIKSELYSVHSENDNEEIGPVNGKFFYIFINDGRLTNSVSLDSIHTKISVLTHTFDQLTLLGTPFNSEILIHVHHVSKDLYLYYLDVEKYRINSSGTDIFAQPISVRGNIQGGLGILGAEIIQEAVLVYQ